MFILILIIICVSVIVWAFARQNAQSEQLSPIQEQEYRNKLEEYRECNPLTAESKLKIVQDCINLVNNTKNPDVFFSRYDRLIEELTSLSKMEDRISFSGQLPSAALKDFLSRKQYTFNDFINRYYQSVEDKIIILTTNKAKENNANNFYNNLIKYRDAMPSSCLDLVKERYVQLQDLFITQKNNEVQVPSSPSNSSTAASLSGNGLISKNSSFQTTEWNIIVSFNKSTSGNFDKALYWAKKSIDYQENEYNGKTIYQAMYSSHPQSFADFMQLYELVKDWKSTAFIINGELVDKKIVGKIKWCYGDKCITGKSDFCYGASYMTKNPFGCHRLQISSCNNPWWSFGQPYGNRIKIDKDAITNRINERSTAYQLCPAFNYTRAINTISSIPDYITLEEKEKLQLRAFNSDGDAFLGIK